MAAFTDARVAQILRGSRAHRVIPFPGHDELTVGVRLLSDGECDDCRIQALSELASVAKKRGWDPQFLAEADPEYLQRLIERQIVWRAFHDPDTVDLPEPKRFFPLFADVASLGSVEQARLFEAYLEHQRFVAPLRGLDEEEAEAVVEALGKGQSGPAFLGAFERSTLVHLLISLVRRLSSSPPSKSSST